MNIEKFYYDEQTEMYEQMKKEQDEHEQSLSVEEREKEYQKLMESGNYEKADNLSSRWECTKEYRKWDDYLKGLPQEEQNYLKKREKNHNDILNELKKKYNQ